MLGTRFKILITITSNSEDLTKPNIQRETYIDPTLRLHNVMNHKYSIRAEAAAILAKRIISYLDLGCFVKYPFLILLMTIRPSWVGWSEFKRGSKGEVPLLTLPACFIRILLIIFFFAV